MPYPRKSVLNIAGELENAGRFLCQVGIVIFCVLFGHSAGAQHSSQCGEIYGGGYGPYDYTNPVHFNEKLPVVERAHFTPEVESLEGHNKCGGNGCELTGDISYTLRAFPNHHRALLAMVRYYAEGRDKSRGQMTYLPECWFERAMRFAPADGNVHMIYGYYLNKKGKTEQALQQYKAAVDMMPNSAEAHYNVALLYTDSGDYKLARQHARTAYELGFPLLGLRHRLERKGQWADSEPDEPLAKE